MKNPLPIAISILIIIALAPLPAWGHGTEGDTRKAPGILARAEYDDGEPMSYAAVEITAPDSDIPFQKGKTDRNGMFMFFPDQSGEWEIVIKDSMGHRLVLNRLVEKESTEAAPETASRQVPVSPFFRSEGVIIGIAVIFGLAGVAYGWKSRRYNE